MASCSNCKKKLSCGCQKRTAKDGASVCSNCVAAYESKLVTKQPVKPATLSAQQKPRLWGRDRYK